MKSLPSTLSLHRLTVLVGPVSAVLPPSHPQLNEKDAGQVCPVTNAKLEHHKDKVAVHPPVPKGEGADDCPVAGQPRV